MLGKKIEKPDVPESFFYGKIVSWKFRGQITPQHGKYCIRFQIEFENGKVVSKQIGGIKTVSEANKTKEMILISLHENKFVPFEYTTKEFFDFWLYYHMLEEEEISYNTFVNYRNIIYNYLLKKIGNKKMIELDRSMLVEALLDLDSPAKLRLGYGILGGAFSYASKHNIISTNIGQSAIREVRGIMKSQKSEQEFSDKQKNKATLTAEQVIQILYTCKQIEPDIYIPLLLTTTTGIRISESLGIMICDIHFGKKELNLCRQVGRSTKDIGLEEQSLYAQSIDPKSRKGYRTIPLADFVLDEIVLAVNRYQEKQRKNPEFMDYGFLSCQDNGKPFYKNNSVYNRYKRLYAETGIPYIKWHGLRHTYATLLARNKINLKAIAEFMGHSSPLLTQEVYIEETEVIYDAKDEMEHFIKEVLAPEENDIDKSITEINHMVNQYLL